YVFGRYRHEMVPVLALFAGRAIWRIVDAVRERRFRHLLCWLAALALAALVVNWPLARGDSARATTYYNTAVSLDALGRQPDAVDHYRKALAADPVAPEPRYNLANDLAAL